MSCNIKHRFWLYLSSHYFNLLLQSNYCKHWFIIVLPCTAFGYASAYLPIVANESEKALTSSLQNKKDRVQSAFLIYVIPNENL